MGDDETFIMEHVKESVYAMRTVQAKYWSCVNGALYVEATSKSASEQFSVGYNSGKTYLKYVHENNDYNSIFIFERIKKTCLTTKTNDLC